MMSARLAPASSQRYVCSSTSSFSLKAVELAAKVATAVSGLTAWVKEFEQSDKDSVEEVVQVWVVRDFIKFQVRVQVQIGGGQHGQAIVSRGQQQEFAVGSRDADCLGSVFSADGLQESWMPPLK